MSLNGKLINYGMPVSGQNVFQNVAQEVTENWLNSLRQGFILMDIQLYMKKHLLSVAVTQG